MPACTCVHARGRGESPRVSSHSFSFRDEKNSWRCLDDDRLFENKNGWGGLEKNIEISTGFNTIEIVYIFKLNCTSAKIYRI